jgi:hypothetical protein
MYAQECEKLPIKTTVETVEYSQCRDDRLLGAVKGVLWAVLLLEATLEEEDRSRQGSYSQNHHVCSGM